MLSILMLSVRGSSFQPAAFATSAFSETRIQFNWMKLSSNIPT